MEAGILLPLSSCAEPFLLRSGPLEQRRLRNMEAGILLASSPRAAKPPTLVLQPNNELVCARKLSAVLGGGCSPQGLCLAPSPQRSIPALMQHRRALDAIGPQVLQGEARTSTACYHAMPLLKGRRCSSLTWWQEQRNKNGKSAQGSIAGRLVLMLTLRALRGT